jgi:hypothetical protein
MTIAEVAEQAGIDAPELREVARGVASLDRAETRRVLAVDPSSGRTRRAAQHLHDLVEVGATMRELELLTGVPLEVLARLLRGDDMAISAGYADAIHSVPVLIPLATATATATDTDTDQETAHV